MEPIRIPVIATGRAGLIDGTLEQVFQETVFSYIVASKDSNVAKEMTVCVHPSALKRANAQWEDLCDYLRIKCKYEYDSFRKLKTAHPEGKALNQ